jgi:transcriptional regulator of arginine metabolism
MGTTDSRQRQALLRKLLAEGKLSTQEELADELRRHDFDITQSTISRDLRKIGAVKVLNASGDTVYKLSSERPVSSGLPSDSRLGPLLLNVQHNGSLVVIHTSVGSASLVAAHLDHLKIPGILGTIAGDDTIFIAPVAPAELERIVQKINDSI